MKKLLLALLLWPALAFGQSANVGGSGISGGPVQVGQVVTVGKSGAMFTTICGASCTSNTSDCAAGSAIASITDSSATKPYTVRVAAGLYDECVVIQSKNYITLDMAPGAIVKPSTGPTGLGTLRIQPVDSGTSTGTVIRGGTFHSNGWATPNAGCAIGKISSGGSNFGTVVFDGVTCIGLHDSIQAFGKTSANTRLYVYNGHNIGGHDSCQNKAGQASAGVMVVDGGECWAWSNYCAPTNGVNFTTCGTGNDTTHICVSGGFPLATSGDPNGMTRGLIVTLASCAAAGTYTSTDYAVSGTLMAFTPAAASAPDPNCTINLTTVNASLSPCTDDWISSNSYWKSTAVSGGIVLNNVDVRSILNNGLGKTGANGTALGISAPTTPFPTYMYPQYNGVRIYQEINYDTFHDDTPDDPNVVISAVAISGDQSDMNLSNMSIKVINNGDPDLHVRGITSLNPTTPGSGTNTLYISNVAFDLTAPVGSFAATISDIDLQYLLFARAILSGNSSNRGNDASAINGHLRINPPVADTLPVVQGANAPAAVSSATGEVQPNFSTAGAAWSSTTDIRCTLTNLPNGLQTVANAEWNVGTGIAAKSVAACVYNEPITALELTSAAASIASGGLVSAAFSTANGLVPGAHWFCSLSDATVTGTLKGPTISTLGTGLAFSADASGSSTTCPTAAALLALSKAALTTAQPEYMLRP